MRNYVQPGDVLTLTAPVGGVLSGTGYKIGQLFVVAAADAEAGEPFEGQLTGVFDLPKATGSAWTEGELLYWDNSADNVTDTVGDQLIGTAAAAAAPGAPVGRVRLNGTGTPDEGVSSAEIANGAVTTAKLAAAAVTKAKAAVFVSAEVTATGSAQNVAHGLAAVPAAVLITMTEHPGAPDTGAMDIAEGAHDATNVVFTATANIKVKVLAWA
jgi:predicted RecA/RadA family phage recombinase